MLDGKSKKNTGLCLVDGHASSELQTSASLQRAFIRVEGHCTGL